MDVAAALGIGPKMVAIIQGDDRCTLFHMLLHLSFARAAALFLWISLFYLIRERGQGPFSGK